MKIWKKHLAIGIAILLVVVTSFSFTPKEVIGKNMLASNTLSASLASVNTTNCPAGKAISITQWEITWTFNQCTTYGTFANGDYWVLGPVVLADINPKGDTSGSMINPVPGNQHTQGFFSGVHPSINNYSASKNISLQLPYTISGNKSLYSTKGSPELWTGKPPEGKYFKETAILTILDTVPAPGSFRPPYAGTDKTIKPNWKISELDYSKLRSLPIPNLAHVELNQSISYLTWATQRPLLEMSYEADNSAWKAQWSDPKTGWFPRRAYGADEVGFVASNAGMQLNSNATNAEKEQLLINIVQWGIDNHGLLDAGMHWNPLGGHNVGRLLPTFIAGKVLNDSEILNRMKSNSSFQELANHHFINWNDINTPRATRVPPPLKPFTVDMLGIPEWSSNFPGPGDSAEWDSSSNPNLPYWGIPYRGSNGLANIGQVATILLMNGRADIDQEAYMRYHIERWIPLGGQVPPLTRDMWNAYIATDPTVIPGTMYTLTATTTGAGEGYIDGRSNKYFTGTTASFTAYPKAGSVFVGWTGDCSGVSSDCTVKMDGNKNVTAIFNLVDSNYSLAAPAITSPSINNVQYSATTKSVTVSWQAEPSGANKYNITTEEYLDAAKTIKTISPERRYAGNTDNQYFGWQGYVFIQDYIYGRNITIPVEPGRYYDFTVTVFNRDTPTSYGWPTGPSATSRISFSIAADGQATNLMNYTLTANKSGNGTGTISGNSSSYLSGSTAVLTATPENGSTFTGWSGACTGTRTCTIVMNSDKSVTATFSSAVSTNSWSLISTDSEDTQGYSATNAFDDNPNTFWHTVWQSAQPGFPHEIVINTGKSQSLNGFSYLPRQDTYLSGNLGQYEFYVTDDLNNWGPAVSTGTFSNTKTLKSVAFPAKTGQYIKLKGLTSSNSGPYMNAAEINVSLASGEITNPNPVTYTLTASATNGTITGGGVYAQGTAVTLIATPESGYQFSSWTGCTSAIATCSVTIDTNKTVTATFDLLSSNLLYASSQTYAFSSSNSSSILVDDSKITNALTVSAHIIRNSDVSKYAQIMVDENYSKRRGYYLGDISSGKNEPICFRINGSTGDNYAACESSAVFNSSTFTHYVGVFDGVNKRIYLYRDGILVSEQAHPSSFISIDTSSEVIGSGFKGQIKDVKIFNKVSDGNI